MPDPFLSPIPLPDIKSDRKKGRPKAWVVNLECLPDVPGLDLIGMFTTSGELVMKLGAVKRAILEMERAPAVAGALEVVDRLISEALAAKGDHLWLETDRLPDRSLIVQAKDPRATPRGPL